MLTPEQVAAFRADIATHVHPPVDAGLPDAARLSLQPSIETIAAQQQLLEHPTWMAIQRRLLDLEPDDPDEGLTCHHSACLVRTKGNPSVRWHTDFHPAATRGQGWLNRSETRRAHGMWFYLNGSHPRKGGLCVIENSHRADWQPPPGFVFSPNRKTFHRIGATDEEARQGCAYARPRLGIHALGSCMSLKRSAHHPDGTYTVLPLLYCCCRRSCMVTDPSFDVDGCVPLVTGPGDMIIFAPRTFHAAFPMPRDFDDVRHSANFGLRREPFMTGASPDCPLLAPWVRSLKAAQLEEALPEHLKRFAKRYPGYPSGSRQPAARL